MQELNSTRKFNNYIQYLNATTRISNPNARAGDLCNMPASPVHLIIPNFSIALTAAKLNPNEPGARRPPRLNPQQLCSRVKTWLILYIYTALLLTPRINQNPCRTSYLILVPSHSHREIRTSNLLRALKVYDDERRGEAFSLITGGGHFTACHF